MPTRHPYLSRRWTRRRRGVSRRLSLVAAGTTCLLLAGCAQHDLTAPATTPRPQGHGVGSPTESHGRPALCRTAAAPTRLLVVRRDPLPQSDVRFTFPARRVVDDPSRVADLRHALCVLPAMRSGVISCPMDRGITYRLRFISPHQRYARVTVSVTGCLTVHGLGSPRWIMRSPRFWAALASTLDVHGPAYGALRGAPRHGAA
jgi:hypothetical protein